VGLIQALTTDPVPVQLPPAYTAVARAKQKRDAESYRAFRAVDQAEHDRAHEQRVTAEVDRWAEEVRLFGEDIAELGPEAEAALVAARAAEDRWREAGEYARTQRLEYERVRGKVSASEETDASLRADAADETAHHAGQVAAQAAEESRQADEALAEARGGLVQAEQALERAQERAMMPAGTAPVSNVTVGACFAYMQQDEVWDELDDKDKFRVRQAGEPRPMMSTAQFQAMLRDGFSGRAEAV
jgi:hypothetical protein